MVLSVVLLSRGLTFPHLVLSPNDGLWCFSAYSLRALRCDSNEPKIIEIGVWMKSYWSFRVAAGWPAPIPAYAGLHAGWHENGPNGQIFGHLFKGSSSPKRPQLSQLVSYLFPTIVDVGKLAPLPFPSHDSCISLREIERRSRSTYPSIPSLL